MTRSILASICLAVLSVGSASAVTPTPLATVYVGTTKGVYIYSESSKGVLTLVTPKPSTTPAGLLVGITGKYMITMGTYLLHSYELSSTGTVVKQLSEINTAAYTNDCAQPAPQTQGLASLNHHGRNVYVVFEVVEGSCPATIQSYNISSTGKLTFNDSILTGDNAGSGLFQPPALMANDVFAYAGGDFSCCGGLYPTWSAYKLRSDGGMLNYYDYNFADGNTDNYLPDSYFPMYVTADPTNHLAAIVAQEDPNNIYGYLPGQLASYTVDSEGNLTTTSTVANMPTSAVGIGCCYFGESIYRNYAYQPLNMSPSGEILAVAGDAGVQVFHFNGADPITPYSGLLVQVSISFIKWDNSNHLLAIGSSDQQIHSFYITPTLITGGQTYAIPSGTPNALVVVPK